MNVIERVRTNGARQLQNERQYRTVNQAARGWSLPRGELRER